MSGINLHLNIPQVTRAIDGNAHQAVTDAAEYLLEEARRVVPIEEGTLERSGKVSVEGTTAAVSFDTPYAVKQHEDLTLRHDEGRQAKYLEQPAAEHAAEIKAIIAARLLGGLR